ncbi:cell surface protein [Lactococcus garvieae]|uniref:DUF916 and DUF3324 domain-containing protein n=1 Tax=Lactococcus petauri TaxID=1940789 RepID=A0ABZ2SEE7_9LACT|nr:MULTISPECIES: DUF916 and DUF3324 domain-containing protein [Lactococcus]KKF90698.1 hypothetical protein YA68_07100 [Lactococcus garvieae]MCI3871609.1 DUF916 and DUF3324 domain-containing protein [Lactococcus petauri]MCQ8275866.1 hypothetical protein [Lactococcus petauri]MCR6589541.1 DUF916 and DUF3324 domain-containing protein [Lactococcus petauri]MCU7364044.1 DUF916 and DUF3324 domain-containing protein [Lactococcus petauri]
MKKIKFLVACLVSMFSLYVIIQNNKVYADKANFSVNPIITKSDTSKNTGYFDLLMQPGEVRDVSFEIYNSSNREIKIKTSLGTAFTGSTGTVGYKPDVVKPDNSLKYNLKDYVTTPNVVRISPKSKKIISAIVKMPNAIFDGVMAGGFNFTEANSAPTRQSEKKGITIENEYRYVIGLIIQQSSNYVAPCLNLEGVYASQKNRRNSININLTNTAMTYLMDMSTQIKISKKDDPSISYSYNNSQMKMAPNSNFELAVPAYLKKSGGELSTLLKPGKYKLIMTVYGEKDEKGKFKEIVNQQPILYNHKWSFEKEFEISEYTAQKLNESDISMEKNNLGWLLVPAALVIVMLTLVIIILLTKQKTG